MTFDFPLWALWLALVIIFIIIEACTMGLTTIWLAAGCLVAMIMELLGATWQAELVTMGIVSIVCFVLCLIWIRPMLDKVGARKAVPTNFDRIIGKEGVVTTTINPEVDTGLIRVMGQVWSAKADQKIYEGMKVKVIAVEGVKAMVEPIPEN